MSTEVPFAITFTITAVKLISTLAIWFAVYRLARRGEGGPTLTPTSFAILSVVWFGWALVSSLLAPSGLFAGFGLPVALTASLALGCVTYAVWPGLRRALDSSPQHWLIAAQVPRVIGGFFLIVMGMGLLPGVFALPAGIGDIITGLSALFVAWAVTKGMPNARRLAIAWNIFGILDLVIAVSTGFVSSPFGTRFLNIYPTSTLLGEFPLTQIPSFLVPIAILMHILSLRGLLRDPEHARETSRPAPAG